MMMPSPASCVWLPCGSPAKGVRSRLFVFPHAGAGAAQFRRWRGFVPEDVEVCPVQLPGRETRISEEPLTTAADLIRRLSEALMPFLDRDYSVFGHSLGAQVAFAFACAVEGAGCRLPRVVAVSASSPPFDPPSHPDHQHRSDAELVPYVKGLGAAFIGDGDLQSLVLPLLRADFGLSDSLRENGRRRITRPIIAFAGDRDTSVAAATMTRWDLATSSHFELHAVRGDHFFVRDDDTARQILRTILESH
jgi:surfactin synthase thioesterase subunit